MNLDDLNVCNNCDAATAVADDPRGYCADCIAETDGPAKMTLELDKNEIIILANALRDYARTATEDEQIARYTILRGRVLDAWVWS